MCTWLLGRRMGEVWREGDTYHHVHAKHMFLHISSSFKVPQLWYSLASNVFIIPLLVHEVGSPFYFIWTLNLLHHFQYCDWFFFLVLFYASNTSSSFISCSCFCSWTTTIILNFWKNVVFYFSSKMLYVSFIPILFYLLRKPRGHLAWPFNDMYGNMDTYFSFFHFFMVLFLSFSHLVVQLEKILVGFVHVLTLFIYCATTLMSLIVKA